MKPNHVCQNPRCPYGLDGKPKIYYACNYCDKTGYRHAACSPECYAQLLEDKKIMSFLPHRLDLSPQETQKMLSKPIEELEQMALEELKDYRDIVDRFGISAAIDMINQEIDRGKI